ncbi:MAG: thioredoxin [Clostridia bacterium]|nr:thioredoxin [Clostridia bacterium]
MIKHVNDASFEKEIKSIKGVCLIDFYADWCGPCMRLAPILEEISNSRSGYNILKVDVDKNPNISKKLEIDTIPTICVYKDGNLVEKQVGFKDKQQIVRLLDKYSQED